MMGPSGALAKFYLNPKAKRPLKWMVTAGPRLFCLQLGCCEGFGYSCC
jgi:hypothetical protein